MRFFDIIKSWWTKLVGFLTRKAPKVPTKLDWRLDMRRAEILLTWKKSVSVDVVQQFLRIYINDDYADVTLDAYVEAYTIGGLSAYDNVYVELWSYDGTFVSSKTILEFVLPDLTPPAAPTELTWTISKVEDDGLPEY